MLCVEKYRNFLLACCGHAWGGYSSGRGMVVGGASTHNERQRQSRWRKKGIDMVRKRERELQAGVYGWTAI